jgi:hypothetical protein
MLPLLVVLVGYALQIPFGRPGLQVYPYSRLVAIRFFAALPVLLPAAACFLFVLRRPALPMVSRRNVAAGTILAAALLGVWTHWAPPRAPAQHFFNFCSPSHEGAFHLESYTAHPLPGYLREFPNRLNRRLDETGNTRVLSNPPGITILAAGVDQLLATSPFLERLFYRGADAEVAIDSDIGRLFTRASALAWLLTLLWIASAPFLYFTARLWFDPIPASALALMMFFTPSAVCFSPGKDPAQLLTIGAMLWGTLAAFERRSSVAGAVAGVATVAGLILGLIHAWVAIIVALGLAWRCGRDRARWATLIRFVAMPAAASLVISLIVIYACTGWNIVSTLRAVAASYIRVQPQIAHWAWYWHLAKFAAFALFAGSGVWMLTAALLRDRLRDEVGRFGLKLLIISAIVMAYGAVNTTLETPRLFVAYIPLLLLGLALMTPLFRMPSVTMVRMAVLIGLIHLGTTTLQWTLFDVRESEMRILSGRMFE